MRASRMMMTSALALALAACGSNKNGDTANPGTNDAGSPAADVSAVDAGATDSATPAVAASTSDFVATAASGGMYEIESSKLAQQKSKSAAVKDFAAMMIADHTKAADELKAAAAKASPPVAVPPAMNAEHQQLMTMLKNATDFDSTYVDQQMTAHQKTLALLDGYASGGDAPAIKDWAKKTTPVVQKHLDKLKKMRAEM